MTISIIIPVFNEVRTIEQVLRKIIQCLPGAQVIAVDDGSTDGTAEVLRRLAGTLAFQLIAHPANRGKGAAIRTGLAAARNEYVLIQDADLEYDPDDYPALLAPIEKGRTSVVYGSRFLGPHRASYFWHRLGNRVITASVNILFNASLTDVETGYKIIRRDFLAAETWRASKFDIEVELTCKLLRRGHVIFEVPISYYGRSYAEGKKITWRDGVHALWVIACCRLNPRY